MWWLWPVEVVLLASLTTYWFSRLNLARSWIWMGSTALTVFIASDAMLVYRATSWVNQGWSGADPEEVKVIDYTASKLKADGQNPVALGYNFFIRPWWASFNVADSRYKVGADMDLFLRYRYQLQNSSQCAEGTSVNDKYRIVQTRPLMNEELDHIDIPPDPRFRVAQTFDSFQVLERVPKKGSQF